jgi:hypothetical protein
MPTGPVTAEELEAIASGFVPAVCDRWFFEPDYQRWLFIDLAARYGRERVLGHFGLTRERLAKLTPESPLIAYHLAGLVGEKGNELDPDFALFRRRVPRALKFWDLLEAEDCPPVDAVIEVKCATGGWHGGRKRFVTDAAKLAVWGDYVCRRVPDQQHRPYLGLWLFDPLGAAEARRQKGLAGFHTWFVHPFPIEHTEAVRVVWFHQNGEAEVLLSGTPPRPAR